MQIEERLPLRNEGLLQISFSFEFPCSSIQRARCNSLEVFERQLRTNSKLQSPLNQAKPVMARLGSLAPIQTSSQYTSTSMRGRVKIESWSLWSLPTL